MLGILQFLKEALLLNSSDVITYGNGIKNYEKKENVCIFMLYNRIQESYSPF